jgi:hypothetical protein
MKEHFIVFISRKNSHLKYVFFVANCESNVKAMVDAWSRFEKEYRENEEDWLLSSAQVSLDEGPQNVARID